MNGKRLTGAPRRLLGDARRETAEALHIAASKRRRLVAASFDDEDEAPGLGDEDGGVFADTVYEADDAEADAIYAAVDARMNSRRQKQRELRLQKELREYRKANPTVRQQFAHLKSGLKEVSAEDWASIPDIGDYSVKKQKWEKYTPAPDSLLESARRENAFVAEVAAGGAATDLASIGAGRTSVLEQKLDKAGDVAEGSRLDAAGYLNEMAGVRISSQSEIGDIKKARLLLKSVTSTNPNHAPGWIAAARLEENAGNFSAARQLILEGCRMCSKQEDVWIEATRLHSREIGRRILAQAVKNIPKSIKIWLQAATLEDDTKARRKVLRKALEIIPSSDKVWKAAVELEEPRGAKILLDRAVECAPKSTDLWLALARLQSYEEARKTLQRAQLAISEELSICITAAQLEETQNGAGSPQIQCVIQKGVEALSKSRDVIKRDEWLQAAQDADRADYPGTLAAIIENATDLGVLDSDRESKWIEDANDMEAKGCKRVARAIYARLTSTFPSRTDLWRLSASFEKRNDDPLEEEKVLEEAVVYCPQAELLWLMLAKHKWNTGGVEQAREALSRAFEAISESQAIWLAAAKVETETGEHERARSILRRAASQAPSSTVYMKSALLERQLSNRYGELKLLQSGLQKYPKAVKLWLMLAQWYERGSRDLDLDTIEDVAGKQENSELRTLSDASAVYAKAVERCPKCVELWIGYARNEEKTVSASQARAILERGRERCKGTEKIDLLWREYVYLEVRDTQHAAAVSVLARALQHCKHSGRLWALSIPLEVRSRQKTKSVDAIKQCPEDAAVILEVAKYIWRTGKVEKARSWLKLSSELDADWGDTWATWLAFEREHGDVNGVEQVEAKAVAAEPKHGDVWVTVSKRVGNESLSTLEVLRKAAALVSKESNITGVYDDVPQGSRKEGL